MSILHTALYEAEGVKHLATHREQKVQAILKRAGMTQGTHSDTASSVETPLRGDRVPNVAMPQGGNESQGTSSIGLTSAESRRGPTHRCNRLGHRCPTDPTVLLVEG